MEKKIICPKCGEICRYYLIENIRRCLVFKADDEPDGATEDMVTYAGKVKRCLACDSKIQIVEEKNE